MYLLHTNLHRDRTNVWVTTVAPHSVESYNWEWWCIYVGNGAYRTCRIWWMYTLLHVFLFPLRVEWNRVQTYWGRYWPIVLAPDDDGWWWVWSSRWNAWQGNWSIRRKPAPVPLCPPQIPHDPIWARTRVTAVGNRPSNHLSTAIYKLLIKECCKNILVLRQIYNMMSLLSPVDL
jgi:hypothetical protein